MAKGSGTTRSVGSGSASASRTTANSGGKSLMNMSYEESQSNREGISQEEFQKALEYEASFRKAAGVLIGNEEFYRYQPNANSNRVWKTDPAFVKSTVKEAYEKSIKEFERANKIYEEGYKKALSNIKNAKTIEEKRYAESVKQAFIHKAWMELDNLKGIVSDNRKIANRYKINVGDKPKLKHNFSMIEDGWKRTFKYKGK